MPGALSQGIVYWYGVEQFFQHIDDPSEEFRRYLTWNLSYAIGYGYDDSGKPLWTINERPTEVEPDGRYLFMHGPNGAIITYHGKLAEAMWDAAHQAEAEWAARKLNDRA